MVEQNHPFITCLLHYQTTNNAHDVATAVAAFTENGTLEINGRISQGHKHCMMPTNLIVDQIHR